MQIYRTIQIDEAVREAGKDIAASKGIYRGASLCELIEPHKRKEGAGTGAMPGASLVENVSPVNGARVTQDKVEPVLATAARERGGQLLYNTDV